MSPYPDDSHDGHDHAAGGHDSHGHAGHHHAAPPDGFDGAFAFGAALNAAFVAAEFGFGVAAHSVALIADAAHNLGDVLGLLLAWGAAWLGRRQPTQGRTYGYGRSSILASLVNAVVLLVGVGAIAFEAIQRLSGGVSSLPVGGRTIVVVAAVGILVNGITAWLFARGRKDDLNVRGAFLHMAADAAVSAGVVVAGLIVLLTGWARLDPLVSLAIAAIILVSTWGLLRDSLNLAMDAVPDGIDLSKLETMLRGLPGVVEVHDLHVWALSTTQNALTAHLVQDASAPSDRLLQLACRSVKDRFGIGHATFQLETSDGALDCELRPAHVV